MYDNVPLSFITNGFENGQLFAVDIQSMTVATLTSMHIFSNLIARYYCCKQSAKLQ